MKLSVIIPVYNVENYLAVCLDSVLTDSPDVEIIVVNDGSTDGSLKIAEQYHSRYPSSIQLFSTPNGGLGHARHVGIDHASGEWLLFVDSDDRLAPGAMTEIINALDTDSEMILFDAKVVNEAGTEFNRIYGAQKEGTFSFTEKPEILFSNPSAWNKLYRRYLFTDNQITYPDRVWYEDLHTTPKLLYLAKKITYVSKPWYEYLQRTGSIMNTAKAARNIEIIDAVDDVAQWFRDRQLDETYHQELVYLAWYNQVLTAVVRVNQIDRYSSLQDQLVNDFRAKYPDWESNRYIASAPVKHRLLNRLIMSGRYGALNLIMKCNNTLRH